MFRRSMTVRLLSTALLLGGCTSMMAGSRTPEVRQLQVPDPPPVAYRKALSTAIAMGTTITRVEQSGGMFQGTLHNAVTLTVETTPAGAGSLVKVTASILPNKVAFGAFTEADDFLTTLKEREYRP